MVINASKYTKLIIYYFSGTGNSKKASEWVEGHAYHEGMDTAIHNISSNPEINSSRFNKETLVGFSFPTHGFNAPPAMIKFVRRFPSGKSDAFIINTRAGMKLYKLHTPGLGGLAIWLVAFILFLKGYRVIGFRPLDMPSNWISLHPGLRQKVIDSLFHRCEKTMDRFSRRILNGKRVLNGLLWIPIDALIAPISVAYYFFGRFALAKTFFANYNCNNCNLCHNQCPVQAITLKSKRPFWTYKCESCMKCMNNCQQRAIETAHGFTFLLWWFVFSILPLTFARLLIHFDIVTNTIYSKYHILFDWGFMFTTGLIFIFAGYRIFHWLLGFKFFNKLFTYTSFTHYKFWRRYPPSV